MEEELATFNKTPAQAEVIRRIITSEACNYMIYGGSRSGKSFIICYILIVRAAKVAHSSHLILRNTFTAAKLSIWLKTLPDVLRICFPNLPVKWNRSDYFITLPNNSTIKVAGLDDDKRVEKLLGTEHSSLWFNEVNQISYPAINKIKTRLAEKNSLKKMCYYDQNPTTTASATYQVFEQGIDPIDGESMSKEDMQDYESFKMNVQGNMANVDAEYVKMLSKLPVKERKRFLDGDYDAENSGAAIYAFNREEHVTEDAIRLEGTDYVGSDFNIEYNSDVLASQHAHGLFVHGEIQLTCDTFKKADAIKRKGLTGASIVCDSTGGNRSTKGKSDHLILKDAGFQVMYKRNPAVKDKVANLNRCFTLGLIQINPKCKKLIRDLTLLKWDKNGQLDQKTDPSLSHLVDGLAYLCWYLYPLVKKQANRTIRL